MKRLILQPRNLCHKFDTRRPWMEFLGHSRHVDIHKPVVGETDDAAFNSQAEIWRDESYPRFENNTTPTVSDKKATSSANSISHFDILRRR